MKPQRWRTRRSVFGQRIPEVTQQLRYEVMIRDEIRCGYCNDNLEVRTDIHLDHIVPLYLGGRSVRENLVTSCADCNQRKGAEVADFWMRLLEANGSAEAAAAARRVRAGWLQTVDLPP